MSEDVIRRCDYRIRDGRKRRKCEEIIEKPTTFSWEETAYSVDLCAPHKLQAQEEAVIAELIQIARPEFTLVNGAVRRLLRGVSGEFTSADVRAWARDAGYEVSDAGVLPQRIKDAFDQAHA